MILSKESKILYKDGKNTFSIDAGLKNIDKNFSIILYMLHVYYKTMGTKINCKIQKLSKNNISKLSEKLIEKPVQFIKTFNFICFRYGYAIDTVTISIKNVWKELLLTIN